MPFETPFGNAFAGTISATVHEHTGAGDPPAPPTTIIRRNNPWAINVRWQTTGIGTGMVTGKWHLHTYLESIGPGPDVDLIDPADHVISLTPGPSPVNYFVHFDVPAAKNPPEGLYKLGISLRYIEPTGSPGPMAGFIEGPALQFYNP